MFKNLRYSKGVKGFSLVEITLSLLIFSIILVTVVEVFVPSAKQSAYSFEQTKIQLLVNQKCQEIQNLGFWIWDTDTSNPDYPGNSHDPGEKWKTDLSNNGVTTRGVIDVVFLKEIAGNLVPFAGSEFDSMLPRNIVRTEVSIYTSKGGKVTQTVVLFAVPTLKKLKSIQYIIAQALDIYFDQNGVYPLTDQLQDLVPNYLVEIPNDPFTGEKVKFTHLEEFTDWAYTNDTGTSTITLLPNSDISEVLTWTY